MLQVLLKQIAALILSNFCLALLKFMFIFNYALQPFKTYCAIWVG
jgi:hypothetical protein